MIYLDYNASTPLDPTVREAMLPFLDRFYGNPSSAHVMGQPLRQAVDRAREQVASLLNAEPGEIVFTSGGTEANNHAIKGVASTLAHRGRHLIISRVEHPAVVNPCEYLAKQGFTITYLGVDETCRVDPQAVAGAIRPDTILVSIMHANNEVGTIQPISEIAAIARRAGVWMHSDAAQSCGKLPTDMNELGVDFLSIAGHKLYAPQGIGALYIRKGIKIDSLHHGAGHEGGCRAGTEPVASIVGLGVAAALAKQAMGDPRIPALRDRFQSHLSTALGSACRLHGHPTLRLSNTLNMGFRNKRGGQILADCPELCASLGAACHTDAQGRSAVLAAMNVPEEYALGAIRFSVGRFTTESEINAAVEMIVRAV